MDIAFLQQKLRVPSECKRHLAMGLILHFITEGATRKALSLNAERAVATSERPGLLLPCFQPLWG